MSSKLKILYGVVVVLGVFILAGFGALIFLAPKGIVTVTAPASPPSGTLSESAKGATSGADIPEPASKPVTVSGTIECLPLGGLECVLGLHGEDGAYYALRNTDKEHIVGPGGIIAGENVAVSGMLVSPVSDIALRGYGIKGTIDITSYKATSAP